MELIQLEIFSPLINTVRMLDSRLKINRIKTNIQAQIEL